MISEGKTMTLQVAMKMRENTKPYGLNTYKVMPPT